MTDTTPAAATGRMTHRRRVLGPGLGSTATILIGSGARAQQTSVKFWDRACSPSCRRHPEQGSLVHLSGGRRLPGRQPGDMIEITESSGDVTTTTNQFRPASIAKNGPDMKSAYAGGGVAVVQPVHRAARQRVPARGTGQAERLGHGARRLPHRMAASSRCPMAPVRISMCSTAPRCSSRRGVEFVEPKTWEDMLALGEQLKAKGVTPFWVCNQEGYMGAWAIAALGGGQLGANAFTEMVLKNQPINSPGLVEAYKGYADMYARGLTNPDAGQLQNGEATSGFIQGRGAMFINGAWSNAELLEALGDDIGMFPIPTLASAKSSRHPGRWAETSRCSSPTTRPTRTCAFKFIKYAGRGQDHRPLCRTQPDRAIQPQGRRRLGDQQPAAARAGRAAEDDQDGLPVRQHHAAAGDRPVLPRERHGVHRPADCRGRGGAAAGRVRQAGLMTEALGDNQAIAGAAVRGPPVPNAGAGPSGASRCSPVAPAALLVLCLMLVPIFGALGISFFKTDGVTASFVGLANYAQILTDPLVGAVLLVNLQFLLAVPLVLVAATLTAVLLYEKVLGLAGLPHHLLHPLGALHRGDRADVQIDLRLRWAGEQADRRRGRRAGELFSAPTLAIAVIILALVWSGFGYGALIILAGLSAIDRGICRSGRSRWRRVVAKLFYITLPQVRRVLPFVSVINVIYTFTSLFGFVYVMTGRRAGLFDHDARLPDLPEGVLERRHGPRARRWPSSFSS